MTHREKERKRGSDCKKILKDKVLFIQKKEKIMIKFRQITNFGILFIERNTPNMYKTTNFLSFSANNSVVQSILPTRRQSSSVDF